MKRALIILMVPAFFLLASCKKNTSVDLKPNINVANDVVMSSSITRYVFNMIIRAAVDTVLQVTHHDTIDSAVVTFSEEDHEYSFEYNWVYCADSVFRSGKFEAEMTGGFLAPGCVTMVNFTNYYEDEMAVNGTDSIVNSGIVQGNNLVFSDYFMNGTVKKVQSSPILATWSSVSQFLTGASSFQHPADITFYEFGTSNGVSFSGYPYTATMDTLVNRVSCPWYYSGRISLSMPSLDVSSGTIDYLESDGCSNLMDYTFDGTVFHRIKDYKYLRN